MQRLARQHIAAANHHMPSPLWAVCPSAACSPPRDIKVPHAIGLVGCLSGGSQRNIQGRQSAIRHQPFC